MAPSALSSKVIRIGHYKNKTVQAESTYFVGKNRLGISCSVLTFLFTSLPLQ